MRDEDLAVLDNISNGRIGWNIVTSWLATAAANYGGSGQVSHADRYARGEEFMTVVKALWDSWAEDAVVDDRAGGRYAKADRIRPINHKGENYQVAGPLNLPRTPQGRPVFVQAGSSDTGRRFAARHAEAEGERRAGRHVAAPLVVAVHDPRRRMREWPIVAVVAVAAAISGVAIMPIIVLVAINQPFTLWLLHSFFLSIPTLIGAGLYSLWKERALLSAADIPLFVVGLVFSFLSAWLCVRWLLRYISTHTFTAFAWYRIAFGIVVLATAYGGVVTWAD